MTAATLILIRLAYLAVLWIFVIACISVIRSDLFGARDPRTQKQSKRERKAPKPAKPKRGDPSQIAIIEGTGKGEAVALGEGPLLVGRGPDAAIRLEDDYVSTRHARFVRSGSQLFVEDLGSTNGTYVGSQRITQPTTLQLGSQIRIGKTILELRK